MQETRKKQKNYSNTSCLSCFPKRKMAFVLIVLLSEVAV